MRRRTLLLVLGTAALAAAPGIVRVTRAEAALADVRARRERDAAIRSADVEFWQRRAAEDPMSAEDRAMAAGLVLQRAREGGGRPDYVLAQEFATASLERRTAHNGKARLVLASSLLAQHHFPDALTEARRLVADRPDEPRYRALLAELLVEIGDYDGAGAQFDTLAPHRAELAVAPRWARYLEFRGESGRALRVLEQALLQARRTDDLPAEQDAWFSLRLADAQMRGGQHAQARRTLDAALERHPDDARLHALRVRWHAGRGEWRPALTAFARVGDAADLQTMALAADAWEGLGERTRADSMHAATDRTALENPEPYNRQWTMFRLERAMQLNATRALLEQERDGRHDVFGLAQLAWARLQTGDAQAADTAMRQALAVGTRDAWLWYVAGLVAEANARREEARGWFTRALALDPYFHHRLAQDARERLATLQ